MHMRVEGHTQTRRWAALAGLVAGFAGVTISDLAARLVAPLGSPVTAVGELIIRLLPGPLVNFGKETLGFADKPILIGLVVAGVLALCALAGRLELARAVGLAGATALLALPLGLALAWVLLAVVNVQAFGWRLPMHLFPWDWLRLFALALGAAALAPLGMPAVRAAVVFGRRPRRARVGAAGRLRRGGGVLRHQRSTDQRGQALRGRGDARDGGAERRSTHGRGCGRRRHAAQTGCAGRSAAAGEGSPRDSCAATPVPSRDRNAGRR